MNALPDNHNIDMKYYCLSKSAIQNLKPNGKTIITK